MIEDARRLGLKRIVAITTGGNGASVTLLERLGLSWERKVRLPGADKDLYLHAIEL